MIAELLAAVARGDGCICLEGDAGAGRAAALDRAAELVGSRVRVLRASPPGSGGFGLPELMAQVAGSPRPGAPPGDDPEGAFEALVDPGEGCSRVALLVDGADVLSPAAIRYIELALRSAPRLCVVLAGPPDFLDGSSGDGFAGLRRHVACRLHPPVPPDRAPDRPQAPADASAPPTAAVATAAVECTSRPGDVCGPMDAAPGTSPARTPPAAGSGAAPAPVAPGRVGLWADLWVLAGVGVAAALLLAVWTANWTETASWTAAVANGRGGTAPAVTGPLAERRPAGVRGPDAVGATAGATSGASERDAVGVEQAAPASARADPPGPALVPATVSTVVSDAPSRATPGGAPTIEGAASGAAVGAAEAALGHTAGGRPSEASGLPATPAERARPAPQAPSAASMNEAPPGARLAVPSGASPGALDAARRALLPRDRAVADRRAPSSGAAVPTTLARDGGRCREITTKITTGQDLHDADREFLRRGCQRRD